MPLDVQQVTEQARNDITHEEEPSGGPEDQALEYLFLSLQATDTQTRYTAASRAAVTGDRRFFDILVMLLSDRNETIRFAAADALGRIGDIRAILPLKQACTDDNCFVRVAAREAIDRLICAGPDHPGY